MNKKTITAIIIFAVVAVAIVLIGIFGSKLFAGEKTYSAGDLTFKSSEALLEKTLSGYDVYFENVSGDVIILGKKEGKEELANYREEYKDLSLEKYATVIYEAEDDTISELKQSDDKSYYYFTYDYTDGSEDIFYVGAMYETGNDFWLINFACKKNE